MTPTLKSLSLAIGIASVPLCSMAEFPTEAIPETAQYETVTLPSGNSLTVKSVWLQNVDWQSEPAVNDAFAVSGDYFFIADRSQIYNPIIQRFDAVSGLFIDEITVNFGTFTPTGIGHLGCDDAGNLYISSSISLSRDKIKFDEDLWDYYIPTNDTISVIDTEGNVTKQLVATTPRFSDDYDPKKFDTFFIDRITVRGDLNSTDDLLVVIPVGMGKNGYGTVWTPNYYMLSKGKLTYIQYAYDNKLSLTNAGSFKTGKLSTGSMQPYFSIYPLNWENADFMSYKTKAQILVGMPEKESARYILSGYNTLLGPTYNILSEGETGCAGAINFEYGNDTMMAVPYFDTDGQLHLSLSVPSFTYTTPLGSSTVHSTTTDYLTIPQKEIPTRSTGSEKICTAYIQAIDESGDPDDPRINLYFYSPGNCLGKYILSPKTSLTGIEPINATEQTITVSGRMLTANSAAEVDIYDIAGSKVLSHTFEHAGSITLSHLSPGVYLISCNGQVIKTII